MSEATVVVYDVRSDAVIARARLSADGIDAWIAVDDEGGLNPGFFSRYGVRVIVRSEDLDDAYVSLGIERVCVPSQVADAMFKHAGWAYPEEACGLVAFDDGDVPRLTICPTNADHSAPRCTVAPAAQCGSLRLASAPGPPVGAAFARQPRTEAYPSAEDIAGGADPEWLHFIVGPVVGRRPLLRAYRIVKGDVTEVNVTVEQ